MLGLGAVITIILLQYYCSVKQFIKAWCSNAVDGQKKEKPA
jgi:hypothetical protein